MSQPVRLNTQPKIVTTQRIYSVSQYIFHLLLSTTIKLRVRSRSMWQWQIDMYARIVASTQRRGG